MNTIIKKTLYLGAFFCATTALTGQAMAQNVATVGAGVTVNNTITATLANTGLNFGVIALVPGVDGGDGTPSDEDLSANATVSSAGTLSAAPGEAGVAIQGDVDAIASVVDDSAAQAALIEISDMVDGATLNITINNIDTPQAGFQTLGLDSFTTRYNGGTETSLGALSGGATSGTETYSSSFGSGTNTLSIGATITADEGDTLNETTPYTGSFDVVLDY